jgi:uncharacterized protein YecE (DUF72 family)
MTVKLGMCGFTIGAAAYYRKFPVVEVQQTFYDPPRIATLERWRAEAPERFEFTMKVWQVITHLGTSRTYRRLKSPFDDTARAEAGGFRWNETVERVGDEIVLSLCRDLGLLHAVDPFIRPSLTPELLYWRLHGNKSHYANYTDEELQQIHDWLPTDDATEAYVLFNNVPRTKDIKRFRELGFDSPPVTPRASCGSGALPHVRSGNPSPYPQS